jgi:hypothetical protein
MVDDDLDATVEHRKADCTGKWVTASNSESKTIICSVCFQVYDYTPELQIAAYDENLAGIYLKQLTFYGYTLLGVNLGNWRDGPH